MGSVELRRDGSAIPPGAWDAPIPLDPGEHTLEASKPGKKPWKSTITIRPGPGLTTLLVPALEDAPEATGPDGASPRPYWNGRRVAGVVLGSTGIGGLIVGAALGGVALSKNSTSKANCSPTDPNFCNDAGASVRGEAINFGNGSTAGLVIGGALLTTGIVVFATAPSPKKPDAARIEVLPGVGALTLRGTF